MPVKLQGAQNQAFSGCGGKYFPAWAGNILSGPEQYPVVAPAGTALRVWLSQALDFWAQPTRRPFNLRGAGPEWPSSRVQRPKLQRPKVQYCMDMFGGSGPKE